MRLRDASYIPAGWQPNSAPLHTDLRTRLQVSLGSAYTLERELGGGMSRVNGLPSAITLVTVRLGPLCLGRARVRKR